MHRSSFCSDLAQWLILFRGKPQRRAMAPIRPDRAAKPRRVCQNVVRIAHRRRVRSNARHAPAVPRPAESSVRDAACADQRILHILNRMACSEMRVGGTIGNVEQAGARDLRLPLEAPRRLSPAAFASRRQSQRPRHRGSDSAIHWWRSRVGCHSPAADRRIRREKIRSEFLRCTASVRRRRGRCWWAMR